MRAELPWFPRLLRWSTYLAVPDAGEKLACQPLFAGMALAMHRTQIEELIAECVALLLLREDVLQGHGEFTKAGRFRPDAIVLLVSGEFKIREKTAPTVSALFEAGLQLV